MILIKKIITHGACIHCFYVKSSRVFRCKALLSLHRDIFIFETQNYLITMDPNEMYHLLNHTKPSVTTFASYTEGWVFESKPREA